MSSSEMNYKFERLNSKCSGALRGEFLQYLDSYSTSRL